MIFYEDDGGMAMMDEQRARRTIFVGDLSFFCSEVDLGPVFAKIGNIVSLEIKRGRHGGSLMHGFVEYDLEASAQNAIAQLNGQKFMGRCMRVNWTNMKASSAKDTENWIQVHVNFLTPVLSKKVSEEFIESVFNQYGQIGDITVKRHLCSYQPPQVTGYGFVYFFDAYAALRAVHGLKGAKIDGVIFECSLSYKAEQCLREQIGVVGAPTSRTGSFFKLQERSSHQPFAVYLPRPGPTGYGGHQHPLSPTQMDRNLNMHADNMHRVFGQNQPGSFHSELDTMSRSQQQPHHQQDQQYGSRYAAAGSAPSPRHTNGYVSQRYQNGNDLRYFAPQALPQEQQYPPYHRQAAQNNVQMPRRMAASAALSMSMPQQDTSPVFMYEETYLTAAGRSPPAGPTSRLEAYSYNAKDFSTANNVVLGGGATSSRSSQSSDMSSWLPITTSTMASTAAEQGLSPLTMQRDELTFSNAFPAVNHSNGLIFDMSLLLADSSSSTRRDETSVQSSLRSPYQFLFGADFQHAGEK